MIASMRRWIPFSLVLAACAGLAGCNAKSAPTEMGDGELVLELGTGNRSLEASLRSAGVTLLPPQRIDDVKVEDPPAPKPQEEEAPKPQGEVGGGSGVPTKKPIEQTPPPVDPGYLEVTLQPNQTLIDLARKHLGSGAKFTEILKANGWNEADAKKLKAGRKVKIPKVQKQG